MERTQSTVEDRYTDKRRRDTAAVQQMTSAVHVYPPAARCAALSSDRSLASIIKVVATGASRCGEEGEGGEQSLRREPVRRSAERISATARPFKGDGQQQPKRALSSTELTSRSSYRLPSFGLHFPTAILW